MKKAISHRAPPASKTESIINVENVQIPVLDTAQSNKCSQSAIYVLRGEQVDAQLGISRSARYDKLNPRSPRFDPTFPKPIKLGAASIGFIQSEVDGWVTSRITASRIAISMGGKGA